MNYINTITIFLNLSSLFCTKYLFKTEEKFTTELLYSQIIMFLKLKWYPKNTFLNNDCPNAILVKAFIDYSCLISRVVLGHRCSEQNDLKLDNQRLLIYTNLLIFYFKEEKHFC